MLKSLQNLYKNSRNERRKKIIETEVVGGSGGKAVYCDGDMGIQIKSEIVCMKS